MRQNAEERKKQRKYRRLRSAVFLIVLIVIALAALWFFGISPGLGTETGDSESEQPSLSKGGVTLTVSCVGDVMVHRPQIPAQYNSATGLYDFGNNFTYVKPYIEQADLALCNVETTFAGGTPTGYPMFNAPDALATALADIGFDVGITANNHIMDKGEAGLSRTLRVLRKEGLVTAGARYNWERNYSLIRVKDLWVAVVPYTYETPANGGKTTINSMIISSEVESRLNSFNTETLDEDMAEIGETIAEARKRGADIVICYYHWGQEYQRSPDDWQTYIAQRTADLGADVIFASHPHVLQGMEQLETTDGRKVPVFYSMGNFLSNQRLETLDNRYTEQGMIARVQLEYNRDAEKVKILGMDAMPTWMDKYRAGGKDVYAIVPLDRQMESNPALAASGHLSRARQALEDIKALWGEEYLWHEEIK